VIGPIVDDTRTRNCRQLARSARAQRLLLVAERQMDSGLIIGRLYHGEMACSTIRQRIRRVLPVPRRIRIRRIRIAREGVAARIPRGPMTLSPGVSHPSLSPAGVIGPPVCREHGTGSCPMAGRVVMARPSRSAWSPIHSPSERIHLMNRRDVSACWRSNSKQVATTQNTDPHELSASNAESKHIGAQTTKEHAVLYGPR
jgi:hypothetical protein